MVMLMLLMWQNHPFESSQTARILRATLPLFAACISGPGCAAPCGCADRFDWDGDGDVDLCDLANIEDELNAEPAEASDMGMPFGLCMTGPIPPEGIVPVCTCWDADGDEDIDLRDFAAYQREGVAQ